MMIEALEYFYEIAQGKTFLAVAEKYNISQSSLSKTIKKLEAELGFDLFARNGRTVKLTQAGLCIKQDLAALEPLYRQLRQHTRQIARNQQVSVFIGLPGNVLQLRSILRGFQRTHPEVLLSIQQNRVFGKGEELDYSCYDMFVTHKPIASDSFNRCDILYEDAIVAIMSATHPLACKKSLCLSDLCGEHISINGWFLPSLEAAARFTGSRPEHVSNVDQEREEHIWNLLHSRGVSLFFASDMYMLQEKNIRIRLLEDLPIQPIVLVSNGDMTDSQRLLREYILSEVQRNPIRLADYRNICDTDEWAE